MKSGLTRVRKHAGKLFCWFWIVLPIPVYLIVSMDKPIYPHYFIFLYPVQFWIAALALYWVYNLGKVWLRWAIVFLILCTSFTQVVFTLNFYRLIDADGGTVGDYGVAYRHKLEAAKFITSTLEGNNFKIDVLTGKSKEYLVYEYLVNYLKKNSIHLNEGSKVFLNNYLIIDQSSFFSYDFQMSKSKEIIEEKAFGPLRVLRLRDVCFQ